MKRILLLPFLAFLIVAFINLAFGFVFGFVMWIVLALLSTLIFFPISLEAKDQDVPVLQIFAPLFFVYVLFSIAAYLDFKNLLGYPAGEALVFGFLSGLGVIAVIMILKGN